MKLKCLFLLLLPVYLFAQTPRITCLESDSILVQSQWYALLKQDAQALSDFVEDSILTLERENYDLRYRELTEEYLRRSCGFNPGYQRAIEQEIEERGNHLKAFTEASEGFLLVYENRLLELWKEELLLVVDTLAVDWKYDFVVAKQGLIYSSTDATKEQALFEQAVLKALNQRIDKTDWETKRKVLQKECLESIRKEIIIHPIDVRKALSKLDVFRRVALWMHGAKLT